MKYSIPIVVAFTENYFIPAVTCLLSILKSSDERYHFEVKCLLTKNLPDKYLELLSNFYPDRMSFSYVNLEGALEGVYVDERYTIAASYRLLLPEILKEYDKIIYIDCDVIVKNDLGKLYEEIELDQNYVAAVYEAALDYQIPYLKKIGCEPGYYFNSGFLIMNLELMRKDSMSQRFIEALKVPYLQFPDQDVLNVICKGRVLGLNPIYNSIRTFFLPQFMPEFLRRYSKSDWDNVQRNGTVHYTGGKPWNEFTVKFDLWWDMFLLLPENIKEIWKKNKKVFFFYKIYKTGIGKKCIIFSQNLYRKLKSRAK